MCGLTGFYLWDATAAMSERIKDEMDLNNVQLGVLFAMYAVPNMFMPVVVAVLSASASALWRTVLLLMFTIAASGWMTYAGVAMAWFWLLLIGRLTFG